MPDAWAAAAGPIVPAVSQIVIAAQVLAGRYVRSITRKSVSLSQSVERTQLGTRRRERLPVCSALESPNAVVRPATGDPAENALQISARQLVNVVQHHPMTNVIDGVTPIQSWQGLVGGEALTSGGAGGRCP